MEDEKKRILLILKTLLEIHGRMTATKIMQNIYSNVWKNKYRLETFKIKVLFKSHNINIIKQAP